MRTSVTRMLLCLVVLAPSVALADCVVFEHRDYKGARLAIGDQEHIIMKDGESIGCTTNGHGGGCESTLYHPEWNDRISSYQVSQGCVLRMWQHYNRGGFMLTRTGNLPYVTDRRNDKVSEALCSC